jgi:hypothetical protein
MPIRDALWVIFLNRHVRGMIEILKLFSRRISECYVFTKLQTFKPLLTNRNQMRPWLCQKPQLFHLKEKDLNFSIGQIYRA